MSLSNCRFYEEKYPEIDSFVMVNVKQVGPPLRTADGRRMLLFAASVLTVARLPTWELMSSSSSTTTSMA